MAAPAAGIRFKRAELVCLLLLAFVPVVFFPLSHAAFADLKVPWLFAAVALAATQPLRVPRRIAVACGLWVVALFAAAFLGVDQWRSLLGREDQGVGAVVLAGSGFLLLWATGLPREVVARLPRWLVRVGLVVAALVIAQRFFPARFPLAIWGSERMGATMGQLVIVGGFLAVALVALTGMGGLRMRSSIATAAALTAAISLLNNRASVFGAALGLAVATLAGPNRRRCLHVLITFVLVAGTLAAVTLLRPTNKRAVAPTPSGAPQRAVEDPVSPVREFGNIAPASRSRQRLAVWGAMLDAAGRRPVLGWGPANAWSAYLAAATPGQLREAGRLYTDAHNLAVESAVTTGVVGILALLAFASVALREALSGGRDSRWALYAAIPLVVYHLTQPTSVVLTPILFFLTGVAAVGRRVTSARPLVPSRRLLVPIASAALLLGTLRFGAGVLEFVGRSYNSRASLRASLRLEPMRESSRIALAKERALDWRFGERAALGQARAAADDAVTAHPWSPEARLAAADTELLLNSPTRAVEWVRLDIERFPNDPFALYGGAILAARAGDLEGAVRLARAARAATRPGPALDRIERLVAILERDLSSASQSA